MEQVVEAYRSVSVSDELKEIERLRELARHNEASAIDYAVRNALQEDRTKQARRMRDEGMDAAAIVRCTELTMEEVRGL